MPQYWVYTREIMDLEGKIRQTKAILLRLYKTERERFVQKYPKATIEISLTKKGSVFASLGEVGVHTDELNEIILPHIREQGLLKDWNYWPGNEDEEEEYNFSFDAEVADRMDEPLEQPINSDEKVQYDELNHILRYRGLRYKPSGKLQRNAIAELWRERAEPKLGIKRTRIPLHTFGSRIGFGGIDSPQKFRERYEANAGFREGFKNFYKGIDRPLRKSGIPATINVENSAIQLTLED